MSTIKENLEKVKETLKDYPNVKIVAATKYIGIDKTKELLESGINDIGENRTDAFLEKYEALKEYDDIKWHFFGSVQSRKIRDLANKITHKQPINVSYKYILNISCVYLY